MPVDPTLTISIERGLLGLPPLLMSASDEAPTPLAIVGYQEPAMQARVRYAPTSEYVHGEMPLGWSWQQSMLGFDVATIGAESEAVSRALLAELRDSIARLRFSVQVTVDGAPAETWECQAGSMAPAGGRTYGDLRDHHPVWAVTLPCYPLRS